MVFESKAARARLFAAEMACSPLPCGRRRRAIAAYADNIVDLPNWVWWVGFYAVFVAINVWGTKLSFRVSFYAAILAILLGFRLVWRLRSASATRRQPVRA